MIQIVCARIVDDWWPDKDVALQSTTKRGINRKIACTGVGVFESANCGVYTYQLWSTSYFIMRQCVKPLTVSDQLKLIESRLKNQQQQGRSIDNAPARSSPPNGHHMHANVRPNDLILSAPPSWAMDAMCSQILHHIKMAVPGSKVRSIWCTMNAMLT